MRNAIESDKLLLVEGNDHRNFFEAFRDHLAIPEMQIENYGGVSQLSGVLAAYASSREFGTVRRLGIVRDAESSAASAFQSVRSALGRANLALPKRIGAVAKGDPMVGVLVLPDDGPGMLETAARPVFCGNERGRLHRALLPVCHGRRADHSTARKGSGMRVPRNDNGPARLRGRSSQEGCLGLRACCVHQGPRVSVAHGGSMTAGEGGESSFGFADVKPLTDALLTGCAPRSATG